MSNEAIIQGIDNKINELKAAIIALEEAKRLLGGAVSHARRFFVESRSGGNGHTLSVGGDKSVVCDCEAGRVGRTCWAKRSFDNILGFKNPEEITDRGYFFDEKFARHYWKEVN